MGVVKLADYRPNLSVVESQVADLDDGYTRIANELLEAVMAADLTARQLKVVMAVIRKTYGFGKKFDRVSNTQIAAMTGIHQERDDCNEYHHHQWPGDRRKQGHF